MNELAQCLGYLTKVFALGRLVRGVRSRRPYPEIPTPPVLLSLLLGVSIRAGSYRALPSSSRGRGSRGGAAVAGADAAGLWRALFRRADH
jgi:hypothetical protein